MLAAFFPNTTRKVFCWWVVTRLIVFVLWLGPEGNVGADVSYYYNSIHALFDSTPPEQVLVEYPTPVVWLLLLPYVLGAGTQQGFFVAFVLLMMLLDGLILFLLCRAASRRGVDPTLAAGMWIVFVLVSGPITYMRLDLITAFLSVLAVLTLGQPFAGMLTGIGAAIKLWPAVLWPATLTDRRQVLRSTVAFVVTGGVLAGISLLWAGWGRLFSPLAWQQDRGLQVESLWASPVMVGSLFDPAAYQMKLSEYKAVEIFGPGVEVLLKAASFGTVIGVILIAMLYLLWLRRKDRTLLQAGLLMIAATMIMIATNKTFSPQYLIWLAGPLAAILALVPKGLVSPGCDTLVASDRQSHFRLRQLLGRIAVGIIVLTFMTQLVYPVLYNYLAPYQSGPLVLVAHSLLLLRNLGFGGLTLWVVVVLVKELVRR